MNEWQKKNEQNLYFQAKMQCMALFRYGKTKNEVIEEIQNGFYTEKIKKLVIENIEDIQQNSISKLKKRVKIPGF